MLGMIGSAPFNSHDFAMIAWKGHHGLDVYEYRALWLMNADRRAGLQRGSEYSGLGQEKARVMESPDS